MKRIIPFTLVLLAFASCKKDRTCTCQESGVAGEETITIVHSTKSEARANCLSTKQTVNGTYFTRDCKLN